MTKAERIITEECQRFGITLVLFASRLRHRRLAPVRWAVAKRLRGELALPYWRIGELLGGFNERSVAYMVDDAFRDRKRTQVLARYERVTDWQGTNSRPRGPDGKFVKWQRDSAGVQNPKGNVLDFVPPVCSRGARHG